MVYHVYWDDQPAFSEITSESNILIRLFQVSVLRALNSNPHIYVECFNCCSLNHLFASSKQEQFDTIYIIPYLFIAIIYRYKIIKLEIYNIKQSPYTEDSIGIKGGNVNIGSLLNWVENVAVLHRKSHCFAHKQ